MRVVTGKRVRQMNAREVAAWAAAQQTITIDLGTGDGRFVRERAARHLEHGVIGVDLCAANMAAASRRAGDNALFVLADALVLPEDLDQIAHRVNVQFPWGSLLHGLLSGHPGLVAGLHAVSRPGAAIEVLINAGALAEAGWELNDGRTQIKAVLHDAGLNITASVALGPLELRHCPSTWARRLAFGRDPRAVRLAASLPAGKRLLRLPGSSGGSTALAPVTHHPHLTLC